jgi:thiol-disulfide isomerase/thioredoxin
MNILRFSLLVPVWLGFAIVFAEAVVAQELPATAVEKAEETQTPQATKESPEAGDQQTLAAVDAKKIAGAKKAFKQLRQLLANKKWSDLPTQMTKEGARDFKVGGALAIASMMDPAANEEIPKNTVAEMRELIITYKFDFVAELNSIQDYDQAMAAAETALGRLGDSKTQWQAVGELWSVMSSSPISGDPLTAEIVESTVENDAVFFEMISEVDTDRLPPEERDTEYYSAPIILKFEKSAEEWLYAGIDMERTEVVMQKFFQQMRDEEMNPPISKDPSFSGLTVDGQKVSLSDYQGKVVLIDFWGTWCGPCRAALPELEIVYNELKAHGFEVIGIAADDQETLKAFFDVKGLPWKNVVDGEGRLTEKFEIRGYPTTLLIDKQGKHVASNLRKPELIKELAQRLSLDKSVVEKLNARLAKGRENEEGQ